MSEDCHLVDDVVVERHLEMMGGKPPVGASACVCNVPVRIGLGIYRPVFRRAVTNYLSEKFITCDCELLG
jgi:hypothetical protein